MMTPPPDIDWARAKAVLDAVLDIEPAARSAELDRCCAGDAALRSAVAGLLAALDDCSDFLAESTSPIADPVMHASLPVSHPERIAGYRILRTIGQGGMGIIYEAEQESPRRSVAVKVLRPQFANHKILKRFQLEAHVLGQLQHPGIAQIHEAAVTDAGHGHLPFLVMELIDGLPLDQHADVRGLDRRQRLELLARVCDAVHHAHQKGIIHRDLKPSNVLVVAPMTAHDHPTPRTPDSRSTRIDAIGQPKVLDFGIARMTDADVKAVTIETEVGQVIGTLAYMSPEQVAGSDDLDTRCDVYALGVILYELLTGRRPLDITRLSIAQAARVIQEKDPVPLGTHDRELRGDVETIVAKALQKSPARRYQSVSELAGDLRRYLDGEPIEARRDHTWYVLRKTIGRHRTAVAVTLTFFALVSIAAVALGVMFNRAERRAEDLRRNGYFQTITLAENALESSRTDEVSRLLAQCPEDLRGWEWWYLLRRVDESAATLHTTLYPGAALSPDGRLFANGAHGGVVEIWNMQRRERVAEHGIDAGFVEALSFSADSRLLAVATRSSDPSFVLDVGSGAAVLEIPATERVKAILLMADGRRMVTGSAHGVLAVRAVETGAVVRHLTEDGPWVTALALSADGTTLAAGRNDGTIETWDLLSGQCTAQVDDAHGGRVSGLVFRGDGARLYSSGWDATVKTWDDHARQVDVRHVEGDLVRGIALSADSAVLAVVTPMSVELRDAADGTLQRRLLGQTQGFGAAFPPQTAAGNQLVTWSRDAIRVWDLDAPRGAFVLRQHQTLSDAVATSRDGRWVASADREGEVVLWDAGSRHLAAGDPARATWSSDCPRVYRLAFNPNGSRLAGAGHDGTVRVWTVPSGALEHEFRSESAVLHVHWSDDATVLAAPADGMLTAWCCTDGQRRWAVDTGQGGLASVACDPGGTRAVTGGRDGTIAFWTLDPPAPIRVVTGHAGFVGDLAWSDDGTTVASGGNDWIVRLWNVDDGSLRSELVGHQGLIKAVDFSADGTRLATSAWEGELRLWDTAYGVCVLRLRGHVGAVMDVDFAADGRWLLSTGTDGTVRIWEAPHTP